MQITLLKSKIHRAQVTAADLHYEGSITIDESLMKAANLVAHEHVHVWNVSNGNRFETYVIPAPKGSRMIQINGAAAHHAKVGDLVIVSSFGLFTAKEAKRHHPKIVLVDSKNKVKKIMNKSGLKDALLLD